MLKQAATLHTMAVLLIAAAITGCGGNGIFGPAGLSDGHVVKLMSQRRNQPYTYWAGESHWELSEDSVRMISFGHLQYGRVFQENTSWPIIRRCLLPVGRKQDSRLLKRPLMLMPLFDSRDPETVLSALYYYGELAQELTKQAGDYGPALTKGLRNLVYEYPDVRVRWKALDVLTDLGWLNIADVNQALSDSSDSVRLAAAGYLDTNMTTIIDYERQTRFSDAPKDRAFLQIRNEIVPVILNHINDNHFNVRFECHQAFEKILQRISPDYAAPVGAGLPAEIDWIRASWRQRNDAREQLHQWWTTHDRERF